MLLVGRLVPEKGVLDAVRVLADLSQTTATTLDIVGDGSEAEPARRLAARLGVADALTVRPWLGAAELAERYRHAHVVLAPSRATRTWVEQFGRMVVEAHAAGAVVAGYASGSLPEVVGDEGVLVSEGDQGALSAAIRQLCDDPDRWQKLRNSGLERAARSTWDDVARGALELYDEARRVRPGARVRAQRGVAAREWGLPATVAGGGRPFAVPLLRDDTLLSRGLAHALDVVNRETAPPRGKLLRVVYVDHVARLSGGELAMLRLIDALPDVEAHVILGEDGPLRPALENAGATIEILPLDPVAREVRRGDVAKTAGTLRATAFTIQYALKLALRLRQLHPDIVHTNSLKSGYYGTLAARLARVPVIWHLRDRLADDYLPRRAATFTRALLRVLPDVVVCNSHETLRTAGRHIRKGTVIGSPVVHDPYAPVRARVRARDGTVVGIVGRLADWKGQREFIRAFAALHADYPGLHARIVGAPLFGEDAYNAELHALVEHLGLDQHVTFVGFVEDVEEELAKLDILVHASIVPEPFGQVVVEGMAAGLPVIATGAGGPAEIIEDGVNGLLVPPGDVPALTAAVRRLLGDAELRARIGQAGIERAKDFAPELIGKQMRAVYESALGRR
jgi:glycosyltransferase involved in cell wall biosynthesis